MTSLVQKTDFPIFDDKKLIYLDSASTSQKPKIVLDTIKKAYESSNANVHRALYDLGSRSTELYESSRETISNFINAYSSKEVIFTGGATESINLLSYSLEKKIQKGDEILLSHMEHHANIVPWQLIANQTGAKVIPIAITDDGEIDLKDFEAKINERTKMAAFVHVSNALGTVNPAKEMIHKLKSKNIPVLLDGAQAVGHQAVNVQELGCDFYVFSSHKLFGPDGMGVLYGKHDLLSKMPPYQGGGDMIEVVSFEGTTFREPPERFEAGTPNISGAVGLKEAINYVNELGWETIEKIESSLLNYATEKLSSIPSLKIIGKAKRKVPVLSFTMESAHPHDVATILDSKGIAVRAGHHCAQPLMERLGVSATTRASMSFYNKVDEIDQLDEALKYVSKIFGD